MKFHTSTSVLRFWHVCTRCGTTAPDDGNGAGWVKTVTPTDPEGRRVNVICELCPACAPACVIDPDRGTWRLATDPAPVAPEPEPEPEPAEDQDLAPEPVDSGAAVPASYDPARLSAILDRLHAGMTAA